MREWRKIALAAVLCAAAACGGTGGDGGNVGGGGGGGAGGELEAPECSHDFDCAFDERCVADRCAQLCGGHHECRHPTYCIESSIGARICGEVEPGDECEEHADCLRGEICARGNCLGNAIEGCLSVGECYIATAYCGLMEDDNTACVPVACGAPDNACDRCSLGPNAGAMEAGGPIIFSPAQSGACRQDSNRCSSSATPWLCSFSFLAYDPTGDLPTEDLHLMTVSVGPEGHWLSTFGNLRTNTDGYDHFFFSACFQEVSDRKVAGAVFLVDDGLRTSQTLCLEGVIE